VGSLFGGSKYQVYGPTAAFIPVIAAMLTKHNYQFFICQGGRRRGGEALS
jgi:SulP family sulfate permease